MTASASIPLALLLRWRDVDAGIDTAEGADGESSRLLVLLPRAEARASLAADEMAAFVDDGPRMSEEEDAGLSAMLLLLRLRSWRWLRRMDEAPAEAAGGSGGSGMLAADDDSGGGGGGVVAMRGDAVWYIEEEV